MCVCMLLLRLTAYFSLDVFSSSERIWFFVLFVCLFVCVYFVLLFVFVVVV